MPLSLTKLPPNTRGIAVKDLHTKLGNMGFTIPVQELTDQAFGSATRAALLQFQARYRLPLTGELDEATDALLSRVAALEKPRVEGQLLLEHGLPAAKVRVRLYHRGFGAEKLLVETTTDAQGFYAADYTATGSTHLEVRVVYKQDGATGPEVEIPLTATKYNANRFEQFDLVAPVKVKSMDAEYTRLSSDLGQQGVTTANLVNAREDDVRQDLSLLRQATGWDARLLALAATTAKLSSETAIPPDILYALARSGLPTDKEQLARVSSTAVEKALIKARNAGIVALTPAQLANATNAHRTFVRTTRRASKSPGALSTFGELLAASGLNAPVEQPRFEELYFNHQGTGAELWAKARSQGLPDAQINNLRRQGQLAYLTLNHAPLTAQLQNEIGAGQELSRLVALDLYQSAGWKQRLTTLAGSGGGDALNRLIPPAFAGEDAGERLDAYAEDLARKVRLAFPTQVIMRMIDKGELTLGASQTTLKTPVLTLLQNAQQRKFELGRTPLGRFLKEQGEALLTGIDPAQRAPAIAAVKQLQRLYQITPGNDALQTLAALGFDSAHAITAYSSEEFLHRFGDKFSSPEVARLVYRKAQQVSAVVYNVFAQASRLESNAPASALSSTAARRTQAKTALIRRFPTLESLFGTLDFCECEHCRSVLSPAAYLVDLLKFLDPNTHNWQSSLAIWQKEHNNAPYPAQTPADWQTFLTRWRAGHPDQADPSAGPKPYDVLVERRPDLAHLPLTCENTNTALPYIDVVNEILEYYVAHDGLTAKAVHDTGSATTPELLAEPQNIEPQAYTILQNAHYPLTLSFTLWLETVRRFCDYFETPLWRVLATFRPSETLVVNPAGLLAYDQAAILAEFLGLSPEELALFSNPNPLTTWFELYGYSSAAEATTVATDELGQRRDLNSAKTLARRLGVSYKELIAIVRTNFVNSKLDALVLLDKLGVELYDLCCYKGQAGYPPLTADERSAFESRLTTLAASFNLPLTQVQAQLETIWQQGGLEQILLLVDSDASGNFETTTLRYARPRITSPGGTSKPVLIPSAAADALAFLKLNLFVRLWKKLGWSIEETDRALQTFIPADALFVPANLAKTPLRTALIYLAHFKALEQQLNVSKAGRLKLLTLWTNLPTTGAKPLYAQLFLAPGILKNDPIFDDPLGQYLKSGALLNDHLLTIQSALGLTVDDISAILADTGQTLTTAPLALAQVSLLYRYGLLAKALRLSVHNLIALKQLTGLDPGKPLHPQPLTQLTDDYPLTQTLRFVELAQAIKASDIKIEDLDYLLRHRFDPAGKYRPDPVALLALVKTLSTGIRAIYAEHALPSDPGAISAEVLQQKLALVLPAEVATTFGAMWSGTVEYTVTQAGVKEADQLDPAKFANEPAIRQVRYSATRQEQSLTVRGVLLPAEKQRLAGQFPQPLFGTLLNAAEQQARLFFAKYLQKAPLHIPGEGDLRKASEFGFLDAADFDLLFTPVTDEPGLRQKRARLAVAFLPFLQRQLIRQLVLTTLGATLEVAPTLLEGLLTDRSLLRDVTAPEQPLLDAFTGVGVSGVSAAFFAAADDERKPRKLATLAMPDTSARPSGTDEATFATYVEVPVTGAYRFSLVFTQPGATAELRFAHLPDPLVQGKAVHAGDELSNFTELTAGVLYHLHFGANNLAAGEVQLLVQGETLPKDQLAQLRLTPAAAVDRLLRAYLLLGKVVQLCEQLALSERELRYLLQHGNDFDNLDLSLLPTEASGDQPQQATALFQQVLRLLNYVRLRDELGDERGDLIALFEQTRRVLPASTALAEATNALFNDLCQRIADLTRRDRTVVAATAQTLGMRVTATPTPHGLQLFAPDLCQEQGLRRLWEALQIVAKLGVPAATVAGWCQIVYPVNPALSPPDLLAREVKNTLKARFETAAWQRIAQPIFDKLRQRQRDALVAYLLHKLRGYGFERREQLFEYFLIDPGMEPVVQTSRLRLAISSVQTFIQRCLLNLEPQVAPSMINAQQWQWLKRYRVWEANRKIFLFPENWLEPEFRDDRTHLFQELESSLLQGDVSNDLVEEAFFRYLQGLEQIAQLEMVAMYLEEGPASDPDADVLHVIGRTRSLPRKTFYRRYTNHMWTPWEPVTVEIDSDHIVIAVWQGRLNLFWLTFLPKSKDNTNSDETVEAARNKSVAEAVQKEVAIQLNRSEYLQGQWSTRESSSPDAAINFSVRNDYVNSDIFIYLHKEIEDGSEAITICLRYWWGHFALNEHVASQTKAFRLVNRHSAAERLANALPDLPEMNLNDIGYPRITHYRGKESLKVSFRERVEASKAPTWATKEILGQGGAYSLLPCSNTAADVSSEIGALIAPFFYQDRDHTFYVEPTLTEKTLIEWNDWGIRLPSQYIRLDDDAWWRQLPVKARAPGLPQPTVAQQRYKQDEFVVQPRYQLDDQADWLTDAATQLQFGEQVIDQNGAVGLTQARQPADDPDADLQRRLPVVVGSAGANHELVVQLRSQS